MHISTFFRAIGLVSVASTLSMHAAPPPLSPQHAESFTRKVLAMVEAPGSAGRRTPVSEDEVNSWFQYHAAPLMPTGIASPKMSMMGDGKISGQAVVDIDRVAKQRSSGGVLDPWSYVKGRVPVAMIGVLQTRNGVGRFELESASVASVPVPKFLLQQIISVYSRTPDNPNGLSLDESFTLPVQIQRIEVGVGQAIVVQ